MRIYRCDRCGAAFSYYPAVEFKGTLQNGRQTRIQVTFSEVMNDYPGGIEICKMCRESAEKAIQAWWNHEG